VDVAKEHIFLEFEVVNKEIILKKYFNAQQLKSEI
jgi:hypothetical protein